MPKGVWLLFLRECSLLDNALGHLEAGDLFDKAFRQQEAEDGTGPPELEHSSWNRRSRLFERHVSGRPSDDGRQPSHGSRRSSGSGSRTSESFRRLSDLVSERPESRERIKAGSRPFRSSRDALFRRESGTERNRSPAHPVTPYSADRDSIRRLSSQSILDRPDSGGSYLDRPESGGSYLDRPDSGGSYLERPNSAWSNLGRPDSSGSNLGRPGSSQGRSRRPDSAKGTVRRPGSAGSNLSRPKSSHRSSRKTESNDGAKSLARSERLLGFEGFREALWSVVKEKYTNLKEAQEAQAVVPVIESKGESRQSASAQPATTTTVPPSAGSMKPESAALSGTPSDEEEVELALMALVSDVVSECHVAAGISVPAFAGRDHTRVKSPPGPALRTSVNRSTSNPTERAARTAPLSESKRFSERTNSGSIVVGISRVGTNIETVHAEKEEEAFTRLLLGRHVASLEHRIVMDRAFLGIMKPQYFDILREDLILLYQVRRIHMKKKTYEKSI